MLSNLTNFLFGAAATDDEKPHSIDFHEIEEDDWMLIEKLDECDEDMMIGGYSTGPAVFVAGTGGEAVVGGGRVCGKPPICSGRRRSISCKRLNNRRCSTPLRELSPAYSKALVPYVPKHQQQQQQRPLAGGRMDESWFITPPPCFVSEPYETRPSSMEDLLIEHPPDYYSLVRQYGSKGDVSVDVALVLKPKGGKQQKKKNNQGKQQQQQQQQGKENVEEKRKELQEVQERKNKFLSACNMQTSVAQKVDEKAPNQSSKNQMQRSNRVQYELSSSKKRPRRADLNKKHSGVNNNRKCC